MKPEISEGIPDDAQVRAIFDAAAVFMLAIEQVTELADGPEEIAHNLCACAVVSLVVQRTLEERLRACLGAVGASAVDQMLADQGTRTAHAGTLERFMDAGRAKRQSLGEHDESTQELQFIKKTLKRADSESALFAVEMLQRRADEARHALRTIDESPADRVRVAQNLEAAAGLTWDPSEEG